MEGVITISFPLLFCGVATPVVAVAGFLGWGPFVGAFAFAFVPLEEGEEGFFAVVRCDGFFLGVSSSLLSALGLRRDTLGIVGLCACPCVLRRESRPPPQRGVMFWVCNEMNWFGRDACCGYTIYGGWKVVQRK